MGKLTLLEEAESYISNLFLEANTSGLFYHDFNHTLSVVEAVTTIAEAINLPKKTTNLPNHQKRVRRIQHLRTRQNQNFSCSRIVL